VNIIVANLARPTSPLAFFPSPPISSRTLRNHHASRYQPNVRRRIDSPSPFSSATGFHLVEAFERSGEYRLPFNSRNSVIFTLLSSSSWFDIEVNCGVEVHFLLSLSPSTSSTDLLRLVPLKGVCGRAGVWWCNGRLAEVWPQRRPLLELLIVVEGIIIHISNDLLNIPCDRMSGQSVAKFHRFEVIKFDHLWWHWSCLWVCCRVIHSHQPPLKTRTVQTFQRGLCFCFPSLAPVLGGMDCESGA
jgi:hypothetical protein